MCDEVATSREHVPALCFFPEAKDLLPGAEDMRRNLFTVPSCDAHNSKKSKDDQYLWHIVTMVQGLNECGQNMVRTKVMRAIRRRPALVGSIMERAIAAYVFDFERGIWLSTAQSDFDFERLDSVDRKSVV